MTNLLILMASLGIMLTMIPQHCQALFSENRDAELGHTRSGGLLHRLGDKIRHPFHRSPSKQDDDESLESGDVTSTHKKKGSLDNYTDLMAAAVACSKENKKAKRLLKKALKKKPHSKKAKKLLKKAAKRCKNSVKPVETSDIDGVS